MLPLEIQEDGNRYQSQTVDPIIGNISGKNVERIVSQQALKRTLPSSILPSASRGESSSSNQFQNAYGSSYLVRQSCLTLSKSCTRDHSVVGNDKEVFMYGINGNWILPSSMINGKSIVATEFATSGDSAHRFGVG